MSRFAVGLDLGQANDFTALSVLERIASNQREVLYHVRHLERVRDVPYPSIVSKTTEIMRSPALAGRATLVIDQTGCGRPVFDMFKVARLKPIGVQIHGGDSTAHEGDTWRVPKRDLVGSLQVLFQSSRLKISTKLPLASVLQAELLNFKVKIDPRTAHDNYSSWRETSHDDLLLSVALAAWWAETAAPKPMPQLVIPRPAPEDMVVPPWRISAYQPSIPRY
jgi:hypothetical protein